MGQSHVPVPNEVYAESLEGAVLHHTCLQENIPFAQVRTISNLVGERNKALWQMPQSIAALNNVIIHALQQPDAAEKLQALLHK